MSLYLNIDEKLEINRELVLSTCHLPPTDASILEDMGEGYEFGYRLYTFLGETPAEIRSHIDTCYSAEMMDLLELARAYGCKWLVLDQDGPEMDTLPKFEW